MAVKDNNGLIYGIGTLKFNSEEIGWISQDGLSPKGEAKQTTPIYAAQVHDGPVDELTSNPGSTAFGFKLIQLTPEMCKSFSEVRWPQRTALMNRPQTSRTWRARSRWNASVATRLKFPVPR